MAKQPRKQVQPKLTDTQRIFGTLNKCFLVILIMIWFLYGISYLVNRTNRQPYPYPIIYAQLSEYDYTNVERLPVGYEKYRVNESDIYRGSLAIAGALSENISASLTPFSSAGSDIYSVSPDFLISHTALDSLNGLMNYVFSVNGLADYIVTGAYILPDIPTDYPDFYSGYTFSIESVTDLSNQTIIDNCASYGYILRYPPGKETETGVSGNTNIFRYVGETVAKSLKGSGMCLEEFHLKIRNYTIDTEPLIIYDGVSAYYAAPENGYITVPIDSDFTVYGNGSDGFVVIYAG